MPVATEKATIKTSPDMKPIKIVDVSVSEEFKEFTDGKGEVQKIEFPFYIHYESEGKTLKNRTTATLTARKWISKFYQSEGGDGRFWVNFTRDNDLTAIFKILGVTGNEMAKQVKETGEFDINKLVGVEFGGFVRTSKDGENTWIDWMSTFEANNIPVPNPNHAGGSKPMPFQVAGAPAAQPTQPAVAGEEATPSIDPEGLPF